MDSFAKLARLWLVYRQPRLTYIAPTGPAVPFLIYARTFVCYSLAALFAYYQFEARQAANRSRTVPVLSSAQAL